MKKSAVALALMACFGMTACNQKAVEETVEEASAEIVLESQEQKQAYAMGSYAGQPIAKMFDTYTDLNLENELVVQGFLDALAKTPKMTQEEIQQELQAMMTVLQEKQQLAQEQAAKDNIAKGEAFLVENAAKEGVMTTESGLQYEVLVAGEGAKPKAEDTVTVHYAGTLTDGTTFDSSIDRGEPVAFQLNRVIPGWTEGVQLMSVGAKYKFVIPSELAYGERAAGDVITPNSVLVFEVELLDIEVAAAVEEAPAATDAEAATAAE